MSSDSTFVERLVALTGLDQPTITSQILPFLESMTTAKEVRRYLDEFLGPHNTEAFSLIDAYVQRRFPKTSHNASPSIQPARGPTPVDVPQKQANLPKIKDADVIANLSPAAKEALKRIDHTLNVMNAKADSRLVQRSRCFCQSRTHPISDTAPICQACGLVICSLNSPSAPCPSCLEPLLPPSALLAMRTRQLGQRNILLDQERARLAQQLAEEEEERRKIKFPTLASTAGHLSGSTLTARIQQSYTRPEESRKVLSLNLGSKKATVHTTTRKAAPALAQPEEDVEEGWIDQDDLGWLKQQEHPPAKAAFVVPVFQYVPADEDPEEQSAAPSNEPKTSKGAVPGSSQANGRHRTRGKAQSNKS